MKIHATIVLTVEPKEDVTYGGTIKDREGLIRQALETALEEVLVMSIEQSQMNKQITTPNQILNFLRQRYADGHTYTFRGLQLELGRINGSEPDAVWLNCKLWEMADAGEIAEPVGDIIPAGILSPEPADRVSPEAADRVSAKLAAGRREAMTLCCFSCNWWWTTDDPDDVAAAHIMDRGCGGPIIGQPDMTHEPQWAIYQPKSSDVWIAGFRPLLIRDIESDGTVRRYSES